MLASTTFALGLGLLLPTALAAPSPGVPVVAAAAAPPAAAPTSGTITGSGTISVVVNATSHSITFSTGSPSQAVGCLDAAGRVVLDDCALFTAEQYHVSTSEGVCSFHNTSQPTNTADVYGASVHAFTCWDHEPVSTDAQFYTVSGLPYNFIGQGDADLYYDIPSLPTSSTDAIDFWYFVWGGEETGVPEGHYQALLLWEPTS